MTKATLIRNNIYLGLAYRFRYLFHYQQSWEHPCRHAIKYFNKVEKELRVLHLVSRDPGKD
jgi:thiol-disulfide isomerase/thioredoxin